jgi:hypothetical protein
MENAHVYCVVFFFFFFFSTFFLAFAGSFVLLVVIALAVLAKAQDTEGGDTQTFVPVELNETAPIFYESDAVASEGSAPGSAFSPQQVSASSAAAPPPAAPAPMRSASPFARGSDTPSPEMFGVHAAGAIRPVYVPPHRRNTEPTQAFSAGSATPAPEANGILVAEGMQTTTAARTRAPSSSSSGYSAPIRQDRSSPPPSTQERTTSRQTHAPSASAFSGGLTLAPRGVGVRRRTLPVFSSGITLAPSREGVRLPYNLSIPRHGSPRNTQKPSANGFRSRNTIAPHVQGARISGTLGFSQPLRRRATRTPSVTRNTSRGSPSRGPRSDLPVRRVDSALKQVLHTARAVSANAHPRRARAAERQTRVRQPTRPRQPNRRSTRRGY